MHIAFFGSPKLASDILTHIHERYPVSLVITQPDKPVGRKQVLTPTPVKTFAEQHNIPILTNISKNRYFDMFKDKQIDIAIVVAYGELIPKQLLETPRFGFLNVHYSLLPAYRGAAPVQWAILNGDEKTGVTIMQLDEVLDHGPLVAIKETIIDPNDTTETLLQRLTDTAKLLIFDILNQIEKNGKLPSLTTQNHDLATSTRQLTKDDGFIPFERLQKALRGEKLTFGDLPKFQKEVFEKKLHVTGYTLHERCLTILFVE